MRRGEGTMTRGMPILGQDNVIESGCEPVDHGNDGIAVSHGKRAAGAEIVLYVDDQQYIVVTWPDLHPGPAFSINGQILAQGCKADSRNCNLFVYE
jgi:hypothetical protein